jgi:3-oxoacyl-[acyl-carrier protein] reductase
MGYKEPGEGHVREEEGSRENAVRITGPAAVRALVTGGSRGIGAAIVEALARAGHPVILNYRTSHAAAKTVKDRLEAEGREVTLAAFDVADAKGSATALEKLLEDPRPIGVLVNNAGVTRDALFPRLGSEQWGHVLGTTLDGFFHVTQPLIMPMVRRRWGRIINIASVAGVMGNKGQVNYSAAKAGLIGATKALAQELASRNITVNAIAPGLIETEMIKDLPREKALEAIPMKRFGQPSEVADLVAFLVSDKAAYITGQVIGISGGL